MVGMTTGPGAGTADQLDRLLAALSDPKRARKDIADIRTAERAAEQRITEADRREAEVKAANARRLAERDEKDKVVAVRELRATRKEHEQNTRGEALDKHERALADQEIGLTNREASLTAREIKVGQRAVGLDTQEATLTLREQATAMTAKNAEAMRSDYEARVARLKRSLAET
jgi:hypothetical protein